MKYTFITIFIFTNTCVCLSQDFNPSLGLIWQDRIFADLALNVGYNARNESLGGPQGDIGAIAGFAGFETDFRETYAPKVGVEATFLILTGRFSVISYFQKGDVTIRALPEIGLGFVNNFNISYGYGFSPHKNNLQNVSNHRLKLTIFL